MASQLPSPQQLANTLAYFAKYDYPLAPSELYFWQHRSRFSKLKINSLFKNYKIKIKNWKLRQQREKYSAEKWVIAKQVGEKLKRFPTIVAVFVTGALAMNNCPKNDDIDLMLVTYPNTLWITRFFVNLYLWRLRRFPGQTSAPDKICPNLWLDMGRLRVVPRKGRGATLSDRRLYLAHEILQAKPLWDRASIHAQFLHANSWVSHYLPIAYRESLRKLKIKNLLAKRKLRLVLIKNLKLKIKNFVLWPLNLIFFAAQYAYMKPKMTSERIGLGFAFFHPNSNKS